METLEILDRLIAFETVSRRPNRALVDFVETLLEGTGAEVRRIEDPSGTRANLYATIGPIDRPGVMLSGHTDVVPADGPGWSVPPFALTVTGGRAHGRGTADMKGFVACALGAARAASGRTLRTPLHLALSYDEEIGCVGVRSLVDALAAAPVAPAMCIVGEPTGLAVATGHKGKVACLATCTGRAAHSALAPDGLNAIHLACELVASLRALQARLGTDGAADAAYGVPHSTVHVGRIEGGTALNVVPERCTVEFELRTVAGDDPEALLETVRADARRSVERVSGRFPEADVRIEVVNAYPGLDTPEGAEVVRFVRSLIDDGGTGGTRKVSFGTEGGLFSSRAGIPTAICGPGSMDQGHRPDEYVELDQLGRCDAMLARLLERLETGL